MYEKIIDFMLELIPKELIRSRNDYTIFPTVCHNEDCQSASHKLYLYKNENSSGVPLLTCFTGCGDTFNIYTFIQRYEELRGRKISYREAYRRFHGEDFVTKEKPVEMPVIASQLTVKNPMSVMLPSYDDSILSIFSNSLLDPWALEGVDLQVLKKFDVFYSKSFEGTIIPHLDLSGSLVGIRIRTSNSEVAQFGKYMPLKIGDILYRHPLAFNLYGIFHNQEYIKNTGHAILVEGEKSVLQYETMFGPNNPSIAVCGNSISEWQMDILIQYLKVKRLTIAFDKEYSNYTDAFHYIENIRKKIGYLIYFMDVEVLIDDKNIFQLKDSPFDRTKGEFEQLKAVRI